ncbi:MAG: response regulator [Cytophagales bacterium]|nr:response regulator [Cytophagales bacterium]
MLIYLVDDDQEDQEIFDMALLETGIQASLKCFNNATSFIEKFKGDCTVPDYVFLDLNMPKINGLECLKILSNESCLNRSRIIVYSTSSNEKDINESKALGAHDYLIKPVSFQVLVNSIKSLLV